MAAFCGVLTVLQTLGAVSDSISGTRTLNGIWKIATDPENRGREEKWFTSIRADAQEAPVPGVIQQVFPAYHGVAWYWHRFNLERQPLGDRIVIHFGAVDYLGDIWLNGTHVGTHEGGETPFQFDVTDLVKTNGENLLAVRVLNPTDQPIDGITLVETPHRNKSTTPTTGSPFNSGGLMYPVQLRVLPPVHVADVFVRPDLKTGRIAVTLKVNNTGKTAAVGTLDLSVAPAAGGDELDTLRRSVQFSLGTSEFELSLEVPQVRAWNLDDPFLYRVSVTANVGEHRPHVQSVRCGFREFRVVDGWFELNGKRIFLKSTHTGNSMPIGQQVATIPDLVRRDLINAKASGFNTVRFISGVAYPEQLDFCDEIGLMVYEECYASWGLGNSQKMAERFDQSTSDMIRRDRNHPSVTIWGLLNETADGPVFQQAVGFLPRARQLDPSRLVILSSGRWDGQWSIGSVSNPGSARWEHVWGDESPDKPKVSGKQHKMGYLEGTGDAHAYQYFPYRPGIEKFLRELGHETKPVLLSEYGIGSLFDVIGERLHFEQVGARTDLEDYVWLKRQSDSLVADWNRLGFDDVYPFPQDLLRESQRLHARQRTQGFNMIRSNPQFNGYNLTGMLDHAMTGEGLWTFWREWKPAVFDAVSDGWSPLRWCLFNDTMNTYVWRSFTVEAVLANEEVLKPGEYPARFRILGPAGVAWEKSTVIKIPESNPLSIPAIRETVVVNGPAGEYTFAATLERGGAPTGGRLAFTVSDQSLFPKLTGTVATWGLGDKAQQWLIAHGLTVQPVTETFPANTQLILVGMPPNAADSKIWDALKQRMNDGATV